MTPLLISGTALLSVCLLFSENHISEKLFNPQHLPMPSVCQTGALFGLAPSKVPLHTSLSVSIPCHHQHY